MVITTKLAAAIYGGAANNKYKYSIQYCPCVIEYRSRPTKAQTIDGILKCLFSEQTCHVSDVSQ